MYTDIVLETFRKYFESVESAAILMHASTTASAVGAPTSKHVENHVSTSSEERITACPMMLYRSNGVMYIVLPRIANNSVMIKILLPSRSSDK
jgi:hypothetical protein